MTARRICIVVGSMETGGAQRVATTLANTWSARGDLVTLVVTYSGVSNCFYTVAPLVHLVHLRDLAGHPRSKMFSYWARFRALRRLIQTFRPDVVLSFLTHVNVASILTTRGLGCRVLVSERSYPPQAPLTPFWRLLRRISYPLATGVVMQTTAGAKWLKDLPFRGENYVIPNPLPFPLPDGPPYVRPESWISPDKKLLLGVGRLADEKQFGLLLQAFGTLAARYPEWELAIIGEGEQRAILEQQVVRLSLQGRVHLPGAVGNPSAWYGRAEIFALCSKFEGFPNALIEAMAYECACVSFDCNTGPRDIIRHGVDGLLVDPGCGADGLAINIARLINDSCERGHLAARASEVRNRFALDRIIEQWDAALFSK